MFNANKKLITANNLKYSHKINDFLVNFYLFSLKLLKYLITVKAEKQENIFEQENDKNQEILRKFCKLNELTIYKNV